MYLANRHGFAAVLFIVGWIATFAALPAEAHWQYTRWGMSQYEVVSASKGAARKPQKVDKYHNDELVHLLEDTYKAKDLMFRVSFLFDQRKKLARVKLEPSDMERCLSLEEFLSDSYGRAYFRERSSTNTTVKWRDEKNKNIVMYLQIPLLNTCSVTYDPYVSAGEKGGL
jgi:hypothetical protein